MKVVPRYMAAPNGLRADDNGEWIKLEHLDVFKEWLTAHRSDIENDINDYGDLAPYLSLLK